MKGTMDLDKARRSAGLSASDTAAIGGRARGSGLLDVCFRARYPLHLLVYAIAFAVTVAGSRNPRMQRVWLLLPESAAERLGAPLNAAIIATTAVAILCAFAAALLRTWGTASLGAPVVTDANLRGEEIVIRGPYCYVRNPLYIGTILHTLALAILMSWPGAIIALVAIILLQTVLVRAEERFLLRHQGRAYLSYSERVPRWIPRLRGIGAADAAPGSAGSRWARAAWSEVYLWGAAVSFAVLGWRYNALLVGQGLLVSFGVSIVARGLARRR